jgi:transposase InsO family protein
VAKVRRRSLGEQGGMPARWQAAARSRPTLLFQGRKSMFARRAVGWATSESNDTDLALAALERAVRARKPPRGLLHHSDRGGPYASARYRAALAAHGMVASMSRKGDRWDNAVAESFFSTLNAELTERETYATRAAATRSIGEYIDGFYNAERRHSFNGYVNPIERELHRQVKAMTPEDDRPRNRGRFILRLPASWRRR